MNKTKNIIVLGDTGSGKSWLLNQLFCPINVINEDFKPIFAESDSIDSITNKISKPHQTDVNFTVKSTNITEVFEFKLSATDTPGIADTKGRTEEFLNSIMTELKTKPYVIILIIKYGRMSENVKRSLEILRLCFNNTLKDCSTIVVINKRPKQKRNSNVNYNSECENMFESISKILDTQLSKRVVFEENDKYLKYKINYLLFAVYISEPIINHYFITWQELVDFHAEFIGAQKSTKEFKAHLLKKLENKIQSLTADMNWYEEKIPEIDNRFGCLSVSSAFYSPYFFKLNIKMLKDGIATVYFECDKLKNDIKFLDRIIDNEMKEIHRLKNILKASD